MKALIVNIQDFSKTADKQPSSQSFQMTKKKVCNLKAPIQEPSNREYHQQANNNVVMRPLNFNVIRQRRYYQVNSSNNRPVAIPPLSNGLSTKLHLNLNRFGNSYKPFFYLNLSLLLTVCAFKLKN